MSQLDRRHRRALPAARRLAKLALVRWDLLRHRNDPSVRRWRGVLAGASAGHIVVPSRAVASSREEAGDFAAHGLVKAGDRVLDVGAGNGRQAIGLLEMGVAEYVGLDVVPGSVEWGNRAFAGEGKVHFDLLDVTNAMYNPKGTQPPEQVVFPYPDASFDFSVAGSLYTHLERMEVAARYVAETARVLTPGGAAYMSFFASPPNAVNSGAVRSVFPREEILAAIEEHFVVERTANGTTTDFHDQWRLYLRKPAG
jgi:SAM-dependent methyltransferase